MWALWPAHRHRRSAARSNAMRYQHSMAFTGHKCSAVSHGPGLATIGMPMLTPCSRVRVFASPVSGMRPVTRWILCAVLAWTAAPLHAQSVLSAPNATPDGGLYSDTITVTLTSPEGAAIRYTLNGSFPNESSPLYSSPIALGEGTTTLIARAFLQGWTPSALLIKT